MKTLLLLSCLFLFSASAYCEIYKWTDASGNIRYGDSKPESLGAKKLDIKANVYEKPGLASKPPKKVLMYSTSWCGYCKKARKYFRHNTIPYVEYDIERDMRANQRYKKLGGNGVPLILYENKRMTGFNQEQFKRFYN